MMHVEASTLWFGPLERDQPVEEDGWGAEVWLYTTCVWHRWLKVVVVIVGLKMPGGGCVPLIPHLISRSRGEALNPKHTHALAHSCANTSHSAPTDIWTSACPQSLLYLVTFTPPSKTMSYIQPNLQTFCTQRTVSYFLKPLWTCFYDVVLSSANFS